DLGDNINLMPLSVWKKFMLPDLIPNRMTLELANRSIAYPVGIDEDVFVPTPSSDLVTPFGNCDFLLEESDAFLALDDSIPPEIDNGIYDSEGDILFFEKLLIDDPVSIPRTILSLIFKMRRVVSLKQRL
nr:reverse transcriptase domain-containing protein [Tanacetum cinerariifolium]